MSHAVSPQDLHRTALPYGDTPFLLYVGSSGAPRVNHVAVELTAGSDRAVVRGYGRGVPKILTPDLDLSLLWPPHAEGGFSLIADGRGVIAETQDPDDDALLVVTISNAVLHRPAPVGGPSSC